MDITIRGKRICQKIFDKLANINKEENASKIFSDIDQIVRLDKSNMSLDELLDLVNYCMKENPENLTENQRINILAFIQTLKISDEEDEWNFLRRSGQYLENGWYPQEFIPNHGINDISENENPKELSKSDNTEFGRLGLELKCPCSSPASVDLQEEECPQMKEYRNLFENNSRQCSEKKLFNADLTDPLDLAKCLHLPPKYNRMSKRMPMKFISSPDEIENENHCSVDFVDTFQFQEWKEDEEIPFQRKPDRLKRSDEKAKIAEQMISYVHDIENNRYMHRVPEVFQRFWMETNAALGIDSNRGLDGSEVGGSSSSSTEENDTTLDVLDANNNNSSVNVGEEGESLTFSAWNAETSSNDMATYPLRQNEHHQPITDSSDDETFMDFFMGRPESVSGTRLQRNRNQPIRSELMSFPGTQGFTEGWNSYHPLASTIRVTDQTPRPLVSYSLETETEDETSNGLSQNLVTSIENYMNDNDDDNESNCSSEKEDNEENSVEEQFDLGDMQLADYFTSFRMRVPQMPNGQIPPKIEVDEEEIQMGKSN